MRIIPVCTHRPTPPLLHTCIYLSFFRTHCLWLTYASQRRAVQNRIGVSSAASIVSISEALVGAREGYLDQTPMQRPSGGETVR